MPSIDFRTLRELVSIAQVLELLDYKPNSSRGEQVRGPCPIHGPGSEASRIFSVNLSMNAFQCFKCRAKGNQLDLWAKVHGLSAYDAALHLCRKVGIEPPRLGTVDQNFPAY